MSLKFFNNLTNWFKNVSVIFWKCLQSYPLITYRKNCSRGLQDHYKCQLEIGVINEKIFYFCILPSLSIGLIRHWLKDDLNFLFYYFIFMVGNKTCFYGVCPYCSPNDLLCTHSKYLETTLVYYLSSKFELKVAKHPWRRTYRCNVLARYLSA